MNRNSYYLTTIKEKTYLLPSFLLSIIIHTTLISFLFFHINSDGSLKNQEFFEVDFISENKIKLPSKKEIQPAIPTKKIIRNEIHKLPDSKHQYVAPSETGKDEVSKKTTKFLSEFNSNAKKEQIRRGDSLEAGSELSKTGQNNFTNTAKKTKPVTPLKNNNIISYKNYNKNTNKNPASTLKKKTTAKDIQTPNQQTKIASTVSPKIAKIGTRIVSDTSKLNKKTYHPVQKKISQLDLTPDYNLLKQLGSTTSRPNTLAPAPFSRASGSGTRFIGLNGTSDYIPGVSDGDITMLNAKADKFAVFVRRVATKVFYQLKQSSWSALSQSDIKSINRDVSFRATLSLSGKLLKITKIQTSGSESFDNIVFETLQISASDPHPPKEAVSASGNIQFIFMAHVWSKFGYGRNGAPMENRWLLLKTGLE